MHADEAILADKFGTLLATKAYPYDPREYHGPILAYVTWPAAQLAGQATYNTLTEITLRIVPALAGILLALSTLLFAGSIGANAAVAAAALVTVSPAMVYYSRYFIPEMLLALWTALLLVALVRQSWMLAGAAAALMIATKETAVLALAAAAAAYVAAYRQKHLDLRALAVFSVVLIAGVSLLLAPPWKWPVLAQAAAAYFERGTGGGGHAHPWYTYLRWLVVTEAPILIAAAIGLLAAWRSTQPAVRFIAIYTILLVAIYSAIPYKTPWCAVSALYGLALLAGVAMRSVTRLLPAAAVVCLGVTAVLVSFRFAADPRNPWVYAHTGPGVFAIRDRVAEFARAAPDAPIDIYSRDNLWPLPWYFRQHSKLRWWRDVAIPGAAAPIIMVSPALEPNVVRKLYEGPPPGERELYMTMFDEYVELRPQVEVRGYVAKSLWDRSR